MSCLEVQRTSTCYFVRMAGGDDAKHAYQRCTVYFNAFVRGARAASNTVFLPRVTRRHLFTKQVPSSFAVGTSLLVFAHNSTTNMRSLPWFRGARSWTSSSSSKRVWPWRKGELCTTLGIPHVLVCGCRCTLHSFKKGNGLETHNHPRRAGAVDGGE